MDGCCREKLLQCDVTRVVDALPHKLLLSAACVLETLLINDVRIEEKRMAKILAEYIEAKGHNHKMTLNFTAIIDICVKVRGRVFLGILYQCARSFFFINRFCNECHFKNVFLCFNVFRKALKPPISRF